MLFFMSSIHHLITKTKNHHDHHKLPTPLSTIMGMLKSKERAVSIHGREEAYKKKIDPGFHDVVSTWPKKHFADKINKTFQRLSLFLLFPFSFFSFFLHLVSRLWLHSFLYWISLLQSPAAGFRQN
jgi:hypothetical protein